MGAIHEPRAEDLYQFHTFTRLSTIPAILAYWALIPFIIQAKRMDSPLRVHWRGGVEVTDPILRSFVTVITSPERLIELTEHGPVSIPRPPLTAFQKYYMQAAIRRGYGNEDAKDTLVLMLEELGELARAVRKRNHIPRHGTTTVSEEGLELADVFIYVVHLANILKVDLGKLVLGTNQLSRETSLQS